MAKEAEVPKWVIVALCLTKVSVNCYLIPLKVLNVTSYLKLNYFLIYTSFQVLMFRSLELIN